MNCDVFWKRLIAVCLTFWLGVFAADFFQSKGAPLKNSKAPPEFNSKEKNCLPADKNLKYQNLAEKEAPVLPPVEKSKEDLIQKNKAEDPAKAQSDQKSEAQIKPQLHKPSESTAEYQNLLHKELCYESDGGK